MNKIFAFIFFAFFFVSCKNSSNEQLQTVATPTVLSEMPNSGFEIKRSGSKDLLEELYYDHLSKNDSLKAFDNQIVQLLNDKNDSANAFHHFNGKNSSYYSSALGSIGYLKDSLLKENIKAVIIASQTRYNNIISDDNQLIRIIERNHISIDDLHHVLKIVTTLPIIESYQKNNKPNSNPLEQFIKKQKNVKKDLESMIQLP